MNPWGGDGAEVIYALRNNDTLANLVLNEIEKEGQNARKVYQRRLPSNTSRDYYFIHRDTGNTQPIIVEYGFLDSTKDDVQQLKRDYTKYAEAVVRAIMEYIGRPINDANTYTVQSGDSLWSIAKKYNITVDELKQANNLTSNSLQIGQILKIPTQKEPPSNTEDIIYIVQSGDSLYKIAQRYNTTVSAIKNYNNLTTDDLQIGQRLRIPNQNNNQPPQVQIYTVKSGDTIFMGNNEY